MGVRTRKVDPRQLQGAPRFIGAARVRETKAQGLGAAEIAKGARDWPGERLPGVGRWIVVNSVPALAERWLVVFVLSKRGCPQASRVTLTPSCRRDNSCGDDFGRHFRLAGFVKLVAGSL